MTVLVHTQSVDLTRGQYEAAAAALIEKLRAQPGFIAHYAWEEGNSMHVAEIWETAEQHNAWFDNNVKPNLPVEVNPQPHKLVNMATP